MSDQQAYAQDMLLLEECIDDILRASLARPLSLDEVKNLRFACGIPERKTTPLRASFIAAYDPYELPIR
jgi:hypothetical protein